MTMSLEMFVAGRLGGASVRDMEYGCETRTVETRRLGSPLCRLWLWIQPSEGKRVRMNHIQGYGKPRKDGIQRESLPRRLLP